MQQFCRKNKAHASQTAMGFLAQGSTDIMSCSFLLVSYRITPLPTTTMAFTEHGSEELGCRIQSQENLT